MTACERPILFSGEMVRAILDGRKTQTRRVVKSPHAQDADAWAYDTTKALWESGISAGNGAFGHGEYIRCPFGQPGDRLWVRETFVYRSKHDRYYYRADHPQFDPYAHDGWKPSIHMPRRASRITLEITGVRVERLQDISEEDARAEGVVWDGIERPSVTTPYRGNFYWLWESINGKRAPWSSNPWVWVVEFRKLSEIAVRSAATPDFVSI